ncbi:MAG: hypothetical protein CL862_11025 [Cyanobium sp. NAT70]|nr:hypothetical protein [Cyanobium sp. NAT70]|tara:strand:- start:1016 stop:1252 length:237 start_codon:yes stop_codon:yes gene_type:complete
MLTHYEINKIKAKLRQLEQTDEFIEQYIDKLQRNFESYQSACTTIEAWEKPDTNGFILQALVVGIVSACLGGCLALIS